MPDRRGVLRLLAAPDKFRGSLSATEVAASIAAAAGAAGWEADELPFADGGEGTLEALGGPNRATVVTGPLGAPLTASWRLEDGLAVIEAARASGLSLAGGAGGNDPLHATTRGTGELIAEALTRGAAKIIVGVGGVATTDGGLGAVDVLGGVPFSVPVVVACDVQTRFVDAASVFAPQKGASPADVELLTRRLVELALSYRRARGIDVAGMPGSGAAGGLAGGLASLGATLVPGFDIVAEILHLDDAIRDVDLVITGEGLVDETSFEGKVVGGVVARADRLGVEALVVAGDVRPSVRNRTIAHSLVQRFGVDRSWAAPGECIVELLTSELGRRSLR